MVRFATAVMAMVMATAALANAWWVPSPVSIALTVGQWLTKDREAVYYIQVQAQGQDEQDARDQAFRLAVDRAVGSLMTSETVMRDHDIVRNEIITYSSGYVHDFAILERRQVGAALELVLDVWVKKSTIADRLLNRSQGGQNIPGAQLDIQHQSILHERQQGDRLLTAVLADYPQRAFTITVGEVRSSINSRRALALEVDVVLAWDTGYLRALGEVLDRTSTARDVAGCFGHGRYCNHSHLVRLQYRPQGDFFITSHYVAFDDEVKSQIFRQHFYEKNPVIRLTVHDGQQLQKHVQCYSHHELTRTNYFPSQRYLHWDERRTLINGQLTTRVSLAVVVPNHMVNQARKIDVEIVPDRECR